jgi:DNA-3-methyladenine glycosylase II
MALAKGRRRSLAGRGWRAGGVVCHDARSTSRARGTTLSRGAGSVEAVIDRAELNRAVRHLKRRDPTMKRLIERAGRCRFDEAQHSASFAALVRSIVHQQLSGKAAGTIYGRFTAAIGRRQPNPQAILTTPPEKLRDAGLSRQKAAYIRDLAARVDGGELSLRRLRHLPDEDVIEQLTRVKGIGRWTAQMFLMFHLGRLDVLPVGDLGIRAGFRDAYDLGELPDAATMEEIAASWSPYRSIGSWYLWRAQDGAEEPA